MSYVLISGVFGKVGGRTRNFVGAVNPLCNRTDNAVSVHQIPHMSSDERFVLLGIKEGISERPLYRALQKVGREFPILLERYQNIVKKRIDG
ncbi:hypothetical protein M1394_03540 [Candidatus Marsarchaeota archaeon]|nr:hypothetical protein [Candidatus Marsarchaeota archaeon]